MTEQTTEAFDWKLIGFTERGRIHWNFSHSISMVCCELLCRWTYHRYLHEVSHMFGGQPIGIILWKWSIVKQVPVPTYMSKPPTPTPTRPTPPTPPPTPQAPPSYALVEKMWIVFLVSLFQKYIEKVATDTWGIRCPRGALGPYTRLPMCHSLITLAALM